MKLICTLGVAFVGVAAFGQLDPNKELVFTDTEAIGLLPPIVVAPNGAEKAVWSPDGKYLISFATEVKFTPEMMAEAIAKGPGASPPVAPEKVVRLVNVAKQTSTVVSRIPLDKGDVFDAVWLPGSKSVVLCTSFVVKNDQGRRIDMKEAFTLLMAATGKVVNFFEPGANEDAAVESDPTAGAILVVHGRPEQGRIESTVSRYLPISSDGRIGNGISVPGRQGFGDLIWPKGSRSPILMTVEMEPGKKARMVAFELNFSAGQLVRKPDFKPEATKEPVEPFVLQAGGTQSQVIEQPVLLKAAWLVAQLKGPHQSALVAAEVDQMSLSPAKDAVYYTTKGVGMIRPLVKIPKELALKALEAAERAKIMS
ncbi:MAG: hypothetical protein IT203_05485, partial [Fimbriimonadaceae bacterium]|nr:hypothetical protein [Fimbriimonadaceae bacterium]